MITAPMPVTTRHRVFYSRGPTHFSYAMILLTSGYVSESDIPAIIAKRYSVDLDTITVLGVSTGEAVPQYISEMAYWRAVRDPHNL
jgi:hypothetical protein